MDLSRRLPVYGLYGLRALDRCALTVTPARADAELVFNHRMWSITSPRGTNEPSSPAIVCSCGERALGNNISRISDNHTKRDEFVSFLKSVGFLSMKSSRELQIPSTSPEHKVSSTSHEFCWMSLSHADARLDMQGWGRWEDFWEKNCDKFGFDGVLSFFLDWRKGLLTITRNFQKSGFWMRFGNQTIFLNPGSF